MTKRVRGHVRRYGNGFGFLKPEQDGAPDVYFSANAARANGVDLAALAAGATVEFSIHQRNDGKLYARDLEVVETRRRME
jgi:cold shock CspA family protein